MRYLVLLAALSLPTYANATVWYVNAWFRDGATLTGFFDDTRDRFGYHSTFDLTTTDGVIPGVHYTPANGYNGGIYVDYDSSPPDLHITYFELGNGETDSGNRQLGFSYFETGALSVTEYQRTSLPGESKRSIISRQGVGSVPEPSVLAMLSALLLLIAYRVCARGRGYAPRCS